MCHIPMAINKKCAVDRHYVTLSVFISKSSDEPSLGVGVKDVLMYIVKFD